MNLKLGSNPAWLPSEARHFAELFCSGNVQDSSPILKLRDEFPEHKNCENDPDFTTLAMVDRHGWWLLSKPPRHANMAALETTAYRRIKANQAYLETDSSGLI